MPQLNLNIMKEFIKIAVNIISTITAPFFLYMLICYMCSVTFEPTFAEFCDGLSAVFICVYFVYLWVIGLFFELFGELVDRIWP